MDILVNDLSIHGQYRDTRSFQAALARLMAMRQTAQRFERDIYCHRAILNTMPMPDTPMQQAIGRLASDSQRRSILAWLTRSGPFWDDVRQHGPDDWLECRNKGVFEGKIVTENAVGEAAFRKLHGTETGLIGATPSDWEFSPVEIAWITEDQVREARTAKIENWLNADDLSGKLQALAPPIRSWNRLREIALNRFDRLRFSNDCFDPLTGVPFAMSSADRILILFDILDRIAQAFDTAGKRTPEGHQLHRDYFHGDKALFSDSSSSEKSRFQKELTFPHPEDSATELLCTWHGKERRSNLRMHYWWSGTAAKPVYIVYVGPKITKR